MPKKRYFLLIIPLACLLFVGLFFAHEKSLNPRLMASAIVGANDSDFAHEQNTQPSDNVTFSDEEIANTSSKNNSLHSDQASGSGISIDAEKEGTKKTEIIREETYSDTQEVHHSVSYQFDTTSLINDIQTFSNEARQKENLPPLTFDAKLAQLAIDRSVDMTKNNYFSHTAKDGCDLDCRFKSSGYATLTWGENLAEFEPYSTTDASTLAKKFVTLWLASSEHRKNLLSSGFTHQGIGIATYGNRIVVTVIFARP